MEAGMYRRLNGTQWSVNGGSSGEVPLLLYHV